MAIVFAAFAVNAQKIGHLNSGNMLTLIPETAKADSGLTIYRNDLLMEGDSIAKVFEQDYKVYIEAYKAGTLSALQSQKRQEELQKKQQYLQAYAQEVEERVANLRRQLLQPILAKLDEAIRAVAKENGYNFIFDTGTGATLYAAESDDVAPLVKKKLGL